MAIQHVDGYVYSCASCGAVYPRHKRRGDALQDEIDHHRAVKDRVCDCQLIGDHQHHRVECAFSRLRLVAAPAGTESTGATS